MGAYIGNLIRVIRALKNKLSFWTRNYLISVNTDVIVYGEKVGRSLRIWWYLITAAFTDVSKSREHCRIGLDKVNSSQNIWTSYFNRPEQNKKTTPYLKGKHQRPETHLPRCKTRFLEGVQNLPFKFGGGNTPKILLFNPQMEKIKKEKCRPYYCSLTKLTEHQPG